MSMDGNSLSGFAPGRLNHGVVNAPRFVDAADPLLDKSNLPQKQEGKDFFSLLMEADTKGRCLEQKDLEKANLFSPQG